MVCGISMDRENTRWKISANLTHSVSDDVTLCYDGCLVCCLRLGPSVGSQHCGPIMYFYPGLVCFHTLAMPIR